MPVTESVPVPGTPTRVQRTARRLLALAPEGTRQRTHHWRSGFYHLALAAGVPVGLGFLDYGRRIAGVTTWLSLSGDKDLDLARIRAFYADKAGLHPALAGEIRLRDDT